MIYHSARISALVSLTSLDKLCKCQVVCCINTCGIRLDKTAPNSPKVRWINTCGILNLLQNYDFSRLTSLQVPRCTNVLFLLIRNVLEQRTLTFIFTLEFHPISGIR